MVNNNILPKTCKFYFIYGEMHQIANFLPKKVIHLFSTIKRLIWNNVGGMCGPIHKIIKISKF